MNAPSSDSPALEVKIVRGEPLDEELAALIAVFVGSAGAAAAQPPVASRTWADPAHRLRTSLRPGPGAWRASLRDQHCWIW
jgi:hypothetical protein